jgi:hypothetical protein
LTAAERRWCLVYAAVLAAVTTLPYLLGYASQGTSWQFTGSVVGVEDGNSYIAKMLSGAFGAWLFRSPYTTFPQRGVLAFLPYLLLGKLAAPPGIHEQLVALFQLFRIGSIPIVVLATYRFAARFLPQDAWRKWVTVMATAGEGLGWILLLAGRSWWLGSLALDFYSPETFGFLSIFALPHLILARAFLLFGLTAYLDAPDSSKKAWQAGWWFAGLGFMQPLSIVSAWVVIGAHVAVISLRELHSWREEAWPKLKLAATALLLSAPWVVYYALATTTDAYMRLWTAQNRILSPAFPHYLLAYGLILIPAVAGIWWVVRKGPPAGWLLIVWAILLPFLAYAPTNLQRRLPEGGWVALVTLAAICLSTLAWPTRRAHWAGNVVLLFSLPSAALLLGGGILTALRPGEPAFRPLAEVRAFHWLADHARPGEAVLSSFATGNALPAWAPVQVVAGHGPESALLAEVLPEIQGYFAGGMTAGDGLQFLSSYHVRFVFLGPEERKLGSLSPGQTGVLGRSYDQDGYVIYEVPGFADADRSDGDSPFIVQVSR